MERMPYSYLPSIAVRAAGRYGPVSLVKDLARAHKSLGTEQPVFVFRVDDYPRWDLDSTEFPYFDSVFRELDVPYTLGIIPWCEYQEGARRWIDGHGVEYLCTLASEGRVQLALHGFTHQPRFIRGYRTEIGGYNEEKLRHWISAAVSWFSRNGLPFPHAFIPPFNTFTWENFLILRESFAAIMAGPPALSTFGKYAPQVWRGTLYLPSYRPLVGLSSEIMKKLSCVLALNQVHAITLHWAWERRTNYRALRDLVGRVKAAGDIWTLSEIVRRFAAQKSSGAHGQQIRHAT